MDFDSIASPVLRRQATPSPTVLSSTMSNATASPTLALRSDDFSGKMVMTPPPLYKLHGHFAIQWEIVLEKFLEQFLWHEDLDPDIFNPAIRANIDRQYEQEHCKDVGVPQDACDDELVKSLVIQFDVIVEYRSSADDIDVNQLISSAFDSFSEQMNFLLHLQEVSVVFDSVQDVGVHAKGNGPFSTQPPLPPAPTTRNMKIAIISGVAVGGSLALLAAITIFGIVRWWSRRSAAGVAAEAQTTTSTLPNSTCAAF